MISDINSPASLAMSSYDHTTTQQWNHSDLVLDDVLNSFYATLIAQTWSPYVILNCMKDFAIDHLSEMCDFSKEFMVEQRRNARKPDDEWKKLGAALPPAPGDPDDYDDIMLGNHF